MKAIEINHLTKEYGNFRAVDALCLEIAQGECFALLGVNGAGKTTTMKLLSGLARPTGGTASVMGVDVCKAPERVGQFLTVSPQETAVAPNLTVQENLELFAGIYGCRSRDAQQRAAQIMQELSLTAQAKKRAKHLSGGYQRRLSIAMALIAAPQVLFLDEPTLGLDVLARRELWRVIDALRGRITIILTTHYLEEAEALADRIGIMASGRLCAVGTAAELMAQSHTSRFEDAFVAIAEKEGALQ